MYRQTSMNGSHEKGRQNGPRASTTEFVGNAMDLLHDVTELVELQVKLLATDLNATARRSTIHIAVLVLGASCLLGVMPVLLMGVAELLVDSLAFSRAVSLLCSATLGMAAAGPIIFVGLRGLRNGLAELKNSNEELARNLKWVKKKLKNGGTS